MTNYDASQDRIFCLECACSYNQHQQRNRPTAHIALAPPPAPGAPGSSSHPGGPHPLTPGLHAAAAAPTPSTAAAQPPAAFPEGGGAWQQTPHPQRFPHTPASGAGESLGLGAQGSAPASASLQARQLFHHHHHHHHASPAAVAAYGGGGMAFWGGGGGGAGGGGGGAALGMLGVP